MKQTCRTFASTAALLALLFAGSAQAGPEEDYKEGSTRYAAGDVVGAMPLLRKAADAGHAAAQAAIGYILDQADWGEDAIDYFRKAAAQGNAEGQFGLAGMLSAGRRVPKNDAEARKWITLAAEQGHKLAINELAQAYMNGGLAVPDEARGGPEALRWIRAAADNADLAAMERLAAAYRNGDLGLEKDVKVADQWTKKINETLGLRKGRRNKRSTTP